MELKEYLKLRYMFLQTTYQREEDLPTSIRLSAKMHEIKILLEFMENGSIDKIYEIRPNEK